MKVGKCLAKRYGSMSIETRREEDTGDQSSSDSPRQEEVANSLGLQKYWRIVGRRGIKKIRMSKVSLPVSAILSKFGCILDGEES